MGGKRKIKMSIPASLKPKTIERIILAQVPVREITPQEQLDILDREIKNICGWIAIYRKAGQTRETATHQATLARLETDRERLLVKMKISPEAHERLLKIRTYLFKRKTRKMRKELLASEMRTIRETHPEAVAENPDDWARLLKAVQS